MNKLIEQSNRRITLIVDPHVRAANDYGFYTKGLELQNA